LFSTIPTATLVSTIVLALTKGEDAFENALWSASFGFLISTITLVSLRSLAEKVPTSLTTAKRRVALILLIDLLIWGICGTYYNKYQIDLVAVAIFFSTKYLKQVVALPIISGCCYAIAFILAAFMSFGFLRPSPGSKQKVLYNVLLE
jgi:hypothetical protein